MELLVDSVSVMIDGDSFWLEVVWTFVPRLQTGIPMEYLDTENTLLQLCIRTLFGTYTSAHGVLTHREYTDIVIDL